VIQISRKARPGEPVGPDFNQADLAQLNTVVRSGEVSIGVYPPLGVSVGDPRQNLNGGGDLPLRDKARDADSGPGSVLILRSEFQTGGSPSGPAIAKTFNGAFRH